MTNTHTHKRIYILSGALVAAGLLFIALKVMIGSAETAAMHAASSGGCNGSCHAITGEYDPHIMRQAERLQRRLEISNGKTYGVDAIASALAEHNELISRSVSVRVKEEGGQTSHSTEWEFSMSDYADAVALRAGWFGVRFEIDRGVLLDLISRKHITGMQRQVNGEISTIASDGYVLRAAAQIARDGFVYDMEELTDELISAVQKSEVALAMELPYKQGVLILKTASGSQILDLLATGTSDYSDSPAARISNVHKAVDERVNNVVVMPGEKFSFVATLGGPVTLDKGWKEALGLFGGGTAMTPGGGICQAATTVFRGALLAGLPIVYKRNHSVFVDHYEPYGVGLDATIFPGVHDLVFLNDTKGHIVMQSYMEGDNVYVNMYGIDDGRTVELDGPYFVSTKPRAQELRPLGKDQIGWVHRVTYSDGRTVSKPLIATYHTGFMRSVMARYAGTPGTELLYMAAPQEVAIGQ